MRTWSMRGGLGLALLLLAPVASQAQPDELSKLRKEVEVLRAEVKELRLELAKLRGEASKEMIVGAWEWVQDDKKFVRITFAQDGRYAVKSTSEARLTTTGSYSVKGDTLTLNYKTPGKGGTQTLKIEKLTDAEIVLRDEKGKLEPYKRIRSAPQTDKGEEQPVSTGMVIRTPNGWALRIHTDGSGGLQYGASGTDGWRFKSGTFDATKVAADLRGLPSDEKGGLRSHFVFWFESERQGPEKGPPARYTRDSKVIPALFQTAIDASDNRSADRKAELLKRYPPALPKGE